jgi:hypothetical protein
MSKGVEDGEDIANANEKAVSDAIEEHKSDKLFLEG